MMASQESKLQLQWRALAGIGIVCAATAFQIMPAPLGAGNRAGLKGVIRGRPPGGPWVSRTGAARLRLRGAAMCEAGDAAERPVAIASGDQPQAVPGRPGREIAKGLWRDWTRLEVKAATALWVNRMVIGLDLCPFALDSMPGLRVVVSDALDRESLLDSLALEMGYLVELPNNKPATTLVVFPPELFDTIRAEDQVIVALEGGGDAGTAGEAVAETGLGESARRVEVAESGGVDNFETFMETAYKGTELAQVPPHTPFPGWDPGAGPHDARTMPRVVGKLVLAKVARCPCGTVVGGWLQEAGVVG